MIAKRKKKKWKLSETFDSLTKKQNTKASEKAK